MGEILMRKIVLVLFASLTSILISCVSHGPSTSQEAGSISVMAYNVENLFDTEHDSGTEDFTFLPLGLKSTEKISRGCMTLTPYRRRECLETDWNQDKLDQKLARLTDVLSQVNNGKGPDVLMMEEVENIKVLEYWNKKFLKDFGYQSIVLIEGPDLRGIDVAMMSRLPLSGKPVLHKIPYVAKDPKDKEWMGRSRGILQSTFILPDGHKLTVFGLHFPSQANPTYWREQSIAHLNKLKSQLPKDHLVIAGGDFNISREEDNKEQLFGRKIAEQWKISHYVGCEQCVGTHNYKRTWSFLDALIFDPRMTEDGTAPWYVDIKSISVPNNSRYQTTRFFTPARFDEDKPVGVSDHWPIYMVLKPRATPKAEAAAAL